MKILLMADEGMMLTDGKNFGSTISLAKGKKADEYTEITKEEYDRIMAEQEEEALQNGFGT